MKEFFESVGDWCSDFNNWRPILITLAIVIIGLILVKVVLAVVRRQLAKTKLDRTIQTFSCSILRFVLYLVLIFCILASLNVDITGLTVVFTAVSLAISLSLQDSLKNLVNGFVLISTSIIKQGDWVEIAGKEGSVLDVRMIYTVLKTADNKKVLIPNSTVMSGSIVNFNTIGYRRLDLAYSIAYDSDVDKAKQVVKEVIASCGMVYDDPAPLVVISELGESSVTLTVRVWCSSADYWDTKWYMMDNIFNEFKRNGITIPFNQLEVAIVDPSKKKAYVRKDTLKPASEHNVKPEEAGDILSDIGKTLRLGKKGKKNKNQKAEETATVVEVTPEETEEPKENK